MQQLKKYLFDRANEQSPGASGRKSSGIFFLDSMKDQTQAELNKKII